MILCSTWIQIADVVRNDGLKIVVGRVQSADRHIEKKPHLADDMPAVSGHSTGRLDHVDVVKIHTCDRSGS